uniref:Hydroxyacyl-CoA dehydrogenase n=1 Tax=Brevibacterium sp. HCU TaxID=133406 RepID=Q93QG7_9MICO|nr:hydroxyacyl-CoA dehydrogenase [Brevibacterium sp. HCU]
MGRVSHVGIFGAGSIGTAFALLFADAGFAVRIFDPDPSALERSRHVIDQRITELQRFTLLASNPSEVRELIEIVSSARTAASGAILVQEAGPEDVQTKQHIFEDLTAVTSDETILASASSAIPSSRFVDVHSAFRSLIGHPGNPPYLLRVVELVGNPSTEEQTILRAGQLYEQAGLSAVRVNREVDGFVFNRIQGAVLREAYALVGAEIIDPMDLDTLVQDGLGLRWSVAGPFATVDLNVRGGITAHAERMGSAYHRMAGALDTSKEWTDTLVAKVNCSRRKAVPLEQWDQAVADRDTQLMKQLNARTSNGGTTRD